jgi:hypothetical protein
MRSPKGARFVSNTPIPMLIERASSASVSGSMPRRYSAAPPPKHEQSNGQPLPLTVRRSRRCSMFE